MYELWACRRLAVAVLERTVRDVRGANHAHKDDALAFVQSSEASTWCDPLGLDAQALRAALSLDPHVVEVQ